MRLFITLTLTILLSTGLRAQIDTSCINPALINPVIFCPPAGNPVCGCNGVTYFNECVAMYYNGVVSWTPGPCPATACDSLDVSFGYTIATGSGTVQFTDLTLADGSIPVWWQWDFGDGLGSSEQHPTHNYPGQGTYYVCLIVQTETPTGEVCTGEYCTQISLGPGGPCPDLCWFDVAYTLDGVTLEAALTSDPIDPPLPDTITWTIDGNVIGHADSVEYLFQEAGHYVLCARYSRPDTGFCEICRVVQVPLACVDSARISGTPCPAVYDPVCGCDGVTYGNACEAQNWGGVLSWTPGACGSPCNALEVDFEGYNTGGSDTYWTFYPQVTPQPGALTLAYFWSFGNGQTSTAESPSLNFLQPGTYYVCLTVTASSSGIQCQHSVCDSVVVAGPFCIEPSQIDTTLPCPPVIDPVCGCDGVTYGNACEAENHYGVTNWTPGVCPTECVQPTLVNLAIDCSPDYDPVCGCDGVTYENACVARYHHGISAWSAGPCCPVAPACFAHFQLFDLGNNTVMLVDSSYNAEAWLLDFGDGNIATNFDTLVHTYTTPGVYDICLTISNLVGDCSDTYCTTVDMTTSTEQPGAGTGIIVAPNPVDDRVTIRIDHTGEKLRAVRAFDALGRSVATGTAPANSAVELDLQTLPAGIYLLEIETSVGRFWRRVIKR